MKWLTGLLGGAAKALGGSLTPWIYGLAGIALLTIVGSFVAQELRMSKLKTSLAEAERKTAEIRVDLGTARGNADRLQAALDFQNSEVKRIAADCRAKSSAADLAALKVRSQPKPKPVVGAAAFNQWLQETFGRKS